MIDSIATKRDYTKFFTYPETADFMVGVLNPKGGDVVLEPSAGNGALVKAVKKACPTSFVFAIEKDGRWENDLKAIKPRCVVVIKDFLELPCYAKFTSCIANPPFGNETNLQDHFDTIRFHVKKGGKIVMIVPENFDPQIPHETFPLMNWSTNKDGTITPIKIIAFLN